jgi:hypothetical protein
MIDYQIESAGALSKWFDHLSTHITIRCLDGTLKAVLSRVRGTDSLSKDEVKAALEDFGFEIVTQVGTADETCRLPYRNRV